MPFTSRWGTAFIALVVLGTVLTAGCTSSVQPGTTQPKSVTVGALLPLTGDGANVGANVNSTIHAAEADVNDYLAAAKASVRIHLAVKDTGTTPAGALAAMLVGSLAIYVLGVSWLAMALSLPPNEAIARGAIPFLVGDALKFALAAAVFPLGWWLVGRRPSDHR